MDKPTAQSNPAKPNVGKNPEQNGTSGSTFDELIDQPVGQPDWLIDGIFPEGSSLIVGPIKSGKSALTEWAACELGKEHSVAYFAFEYSERMLVLRLKGLEDQGLAAKHVRYWHNGDIVAAQVSAAALFETAITQMRPSIVILDTLASVKPMTSGQYQEEWRAIMQVRAVTDAIDATLIMVHHTRKAGPDGEFDPRESVLGSQGIAAAVDNVLVYKRDAANTTIRGYGRLVDDFETHLDFDRGVFSVRDPDEVAIQILKRKAPSEYRVLQTLDVGPMSAHAIHTAVNTNSTSSKPLSLDGVYQILKALSKKEHVVPPEQPGGTWSRRKASTAQL